MGRARTTGWQRAGHREMGMVKPTGGEENEEREREGQTDGETDMKDRETKEDGAQR